MISGTSDDGKAPCGPKFMHIFKMSKIRHSHREYDMRRSCGTKPGPNRAKVGPANPPSLADWLGVGAFLNSALSTCQGMLVHGASNAQSWGGQETWLADHLSWPDGLTSRPPEPHFWTKPRLNPPINTPVLLPTKSVKKVRFSSYSAHKFILYIVEREARF
jgi:hypothetical protein